MPPSLYFARWRQLLMQTAMWVVLGASVALAAMLDGHLRQQQIIDLSPPAIDGSLSYRLPSGWKNWTRQAEGDATAHVATDSTGGITRTLIISRQRVPHSMAPSEYILRALPLTGSLGTQDFKGIVIDGWPGQSIYWESRRVSLGAGEASQFTNCSAIVLPGDEAIMVHLDKNAKFDAADLRLYRQIIDHIHIASAGPTDGGTIQLDNNITVTVPSDLRLYPKADPLCSDWTVAQIPDDGGWISAEFVPVAVPENEPTASLLAGLAAREQLDPSHAALANAWITAQVSAEGPNHWTFALQDRATDAVSPRRIAHLLTSDGGWGLVVILSAEPGATFADLDHLWEELSANIRIGKKSPDLKSSLLAGASVARNAAPARNAAIPPVDTWWIWSRGSVPIGFTHGSTDPDAKYVFRDTVRRNWNGTATAAAQQWGVSGDLTPTPWARVSRFDAEANLNDPMAPLFDQATTVGDTITTIIHDRLGHITTAETRLSPAFVLSRFLPGLVSRIESTPMAFWTDRFPSVEAELFRTPLLLLVNRLDDQPGLRCVQTQVNGTGRLARWYFRTNGALDHADFAGDLHLRPSSVAEVESAFAGDHRLTTPPH